MGKSLLFFSVLLSIAFQRCNAQKKSPYVSLSDLTFSSIFAGSKKDSLHTYCLLGTGYFRTPRSDNSDSLINAWLTSHPNANVIPVATHGPTVTAYPDSKMTYCWLIDSKDTLNNFLIKNGCFPGGTMMRPKTWQEMSDQEKTIWGKDPKLIVYLDKKTYDKFLEQIKAAEEYARQNRLGIWNKNEEIQY